MTELLVCVTNQTPNMRACTVKDEHASNCDGWGSRLTDAGWVATGHECTGCLPRQARHGLLCHSCYTRLEEALSKIEPWYEAMRGVDRAVQRDNAGVRAKSGPPIPISPVQLAVDEVWSWHRHYKGNPELWVSNETGATQAVQFTKVALAAIRSHEHVESPTKVRRVKCPKCGLPQLVRIPPSHFKDALTFTCQHEGCDGTLDQTSFERAAELTERRPA